MSGYGQEIKLVVTDRHSIVMDRHQKNNNLLTIMLFDYLFFP